MNTLSEACSKRPFSNGSEGEAWMGVWCEHCANDHGMHHGGGDTAGACDIILLSMLPDFPSDDFPWPEAWLPEPTGSFALPSRMICGAFKPCEPCGGDPLAETRAAITEEVTDFWRASGTGEDAP